MVLEHEITILKEIEIPEAFIRMRSDNIVHVFYKENVTLDIGLQMRTNDLFRQITANKKTNFIFEADEGFVLTPDARDNAKDIEHDSPVAASAIIVKNLPSRIIANFYVKVVRPRINHKIFGNVADAAKWLKSL